MIVRPLVHHFDIHGVRCPKVRLDNRHAHPFAHRHQPKRVRIGCHYKHASTACLRDGTKSSASLTYSDGSLSDFKALELTSIRDIDHISRCPPKSFWGLRGASSILT